MSFKYQITFLTLTFTLILFGCTKKTPAAPGPPPGGGGGGGGGDTNVVINPPVEPTIANTIGFFLDEWTPRSFTAPTYNEETVTSSAAQSTVTVDASAIITKIPLSIFGQNAVWWMGPVSTTPAAITHITNLHPQIIRFPGGSSSDAYFWNGAQGVNPAGAPAMITDKDGNKKEPGYNYGKTTYNWQCNLDDYYSMLQQTGNKGIITVNYGYARYGTGTNPVADAAHLAADWVRYDNGRTQYWEVGNENFGDWEWGYRIDRSLNKDGQPEYITGALYAQHFQVFADSMKNAAAEIGAAIHIGAVTLDAPATESWQTTTAKTWNTGMMSGINGKADFYVVHNYFTPYDQNSTASVIFSAATTIPAQMMTYVTQTLQANGAAIKPIAMDEWNMWAKDSKQQVSNVSGAFAVLVMGEALKNKYGLAARWDIMNGWSNGNDHGLFSAGDEPGVAKWSPRPSFYYLYFLQRLLGDRLVAATTTGNTGIKAYASTYTSGPANVNLVNTTSSPLVVEVKMSNFLTGARFYWYSLEGSTDNGEFSRKVIINGNGPSGEAGGPADYISIKAKSAVTTAGIKINVPARGAVCLVIDKK
ncbi:MAG TPA: alpha-L-arabinofuranosidase [Panacibacter sp.]|nr:alpha-L-arabinofuranosidase [Panacibacter sp.]